MGNIKKCINENKTIISIIILFFSIIIGILFITLFEMKLNSEELSKVRFMFLFSLQKFIEIVLLSFCVGFIYDFLNEKSKTEEEQKREQIIQKRYTFTLTVFKRVDLLNNLSEIYKEKGYGNNSQKDIDAGVRFKNLSYKLERIPLNINENSKLEMKEILEEMDSIISSLDSEKEIDELIKERDKLIKENNISVKELDVLVKERDELIKENNISVKELDELSIEYDEYSKE